MCIAHVHYLFLAVLGPVNAGCAGMVPDPCQIRFRS